MTGVRHAARHIFTTRRGVRTFLGSLLAAFGGMSAIIQFVGQLFPKAYPQPGPVTVVSLGCCVLWALVRAYPKTTVRYMFKYPEMTVVVEPGDLFERPEHLVVGFSDTFDTSLDHGIVSAASVQGQLLDRCYGGDQGRLDDDLSAALHDVAPAAREARECKPHGKLSRYRIGTVAVLGARPQLVFGVAYARLGNDYVATSSVEDLWFSLNRLWDAVYRYGQQECIAMPLVGSGLSRLDFLDRENLLRLILLCFVTRSRERQISRELRIVIRPAELEKVNLVEIEAFLRTLGSGLAHPP